MAKPKTTKRQSTSARDPVTHYAQEVIAGKIIAGPHVRNACRRHLRDLQEGPARGLIWDLTAALWIINFFPDVLCLASGKFEGRPFVLEPSQEFIVGSLAGWKWQGTGLRRFRRAYIEAGKGSGKTPLAAGIGMYCLVADGEARAEVYAAASMKSQAMYIFRAAVAMWQQSSALVSKLTPSGGNPIWNLADLNTGSFFRPISTEEGHSGPIPSCALCDEVHEHRDGRMIEMLERGFKSRRQPFLIMITNSGSDRNSVCWEEHEHAVKVAAGTRTPDDNATFVGEVIDDNAFSYVCALDKTDDPLNDPKCWVKANPLLGITMPVEELTRAVAQAKAIPGKLNGVLRLHFCQWTSADEAWISQAALDAVLADFDPLVEHAGKRASVGIDLSGTQDLTAMAFVVESGSIEVDSDTGGKIRLPCYDAWVEAWTPADTVAERALRDRAPYDVWVERGELHATPGKVIRLDFVAARLVEAGTELQIGDVAYDRYAYRKFEQELDELGASFKQIEHPQGGKRRGPAPDDEIEAAKRAGREAPQGLWMPGSLNTLETLIIEGRIRLRRNPVLVSACLSAAIERDPFDNRWFSKRKATNRIDPLVALAMAVGAATRTGETAEIDIAAMIA